MRMLASIAVAISCLLAPAIAQKITSTNIHRLIIDNKKGMSLEEIKGVFSMRYKEISGNDRKISLDEFMEMPEFNEFRRKVLNHPSIVNIPDDEKAQMEELFRKTQAQTFAVFDGNDDQFISEAEFVQISLNSVERVDRNEDGFLSMQEVEEDMERRRTLAREFEKLDEK